MPRLVARPIADCHDWLYDQSQIAATGCTTNCRLPRLVVRPIADCRDWLHDQSQIATTGCTTNCRLPRLYGAGTASAWGCWLHDKRQIAATGCTTNCRLPRLVARPAADCHDWLHDQLQIATTGCTTNCRLPRLVARPTADCHDSMGLARPLLGDAGMSSSGGAGWIPTFTWPSVVTSSVSGCDLFALPWPFLGGISSALLCQEVKRILILTLLLSWCFTSTETVWLNKLLATGLLTLDWAPFICEGRPVGRPVVRSCNWSWLVTTGRTISRDVVRPVARPIVRPVWPRSIVDRHDWWHDWSYDHNYTTRLKPPAICNRRARVLIMTVGLAATICF